MKIKLDLVVGEQQHSKRFYSQNEISSAISKAKFPMLVDNSPESDAHLAGVCGVVYDMQIEGNDIVSNFELNKNLPFGFIINELIKAGVEPKFCVCGFGNVDENFIVSNYRITKVYVDMGG